MNLSNFNLSRGLRLALLLLLLTAQGIVSAHELGSSHSLDSHLCATCVVGHGLGAALGASHEAPAVQVSRAAPPATPSVFTPAALASCHYARGPPALSGTHQA